MKMCRTENICCMEYNHKGRNSLWLRIERRARSRYALERNEWTVGRILFDQLRGCSEAGQKIMKSPKQSLRTVNCQCYLGSENIAYQDLRVIGDRTGLDSHLWSVFGL